MSTLEVWILAIGLAMDCLAVSVTSGISLHKILWRPILTMAFFFGLFQGIMPLIGWAVAGTFSHLINQFDHWIAFGILAFLGGRMLLESFKEEDCKSDLNPSNLKIVFIMAIATSIDALAVGVSFAFLNMSNQAILAAVGIIGLVSFIMSVGGLLFGIRFGCKYARKIKADMWGGIILILIGSKILIEHTLLS